MPSQPTIQDVHYSQTLTNFSVAYVQNNTSFASAQNAVPTIGVQHKSDNFWRYDRADFFRMAAKLRAPGTEAAQSGFNLDPNSVYVCKNWALRKCIADDERDNADPAVDLDKMTAEYLTAQMMLAQELDFFSKFLKTGVWTTNPTLTLTWDAAGSTPIKNLRDAILLQQKLTGLKADTAVMGEYVWAKLQDNADFLARVNFGTPGSAANPSMVTTELLAQILGVRRVIISGAVHNKAAEGLTPDYDFVAGKSALVMYSPPTAQLMQAAAAVKFVWTGRKGAGADGQILRTYREERLKADIVEIECAWTHDMVCPELGIYFDAAVA